MKQKSELLSRALLTFFLVITATPVLAREKGEKTEPVPVQTGSIEGTVRDEQDNAVTGACVILIDDASGVPVRRDSYQPFTRNVEDDDSYEKIAFSLTDENGEFAFSDLPEGTYRLIAQSWNSDKPTANPLDVNGTVVFLHGVAENVKVSPGKASEVHITPLGNLSLRVKVKSANNDTLLLVSREPTSADPATGFTGWVGPFAKNILAGNRMPQGKTTIRGLPPGMVHVAVFANDDRPGWGAASVELQPATVTTVVIPFVAEWSDGMQSPSPKLAKLQEKLIDLKLDTRSAVYQLLEDNGISLDTTSGFYSAYANLGRHVGDILTLPDGSQVTVGDFISAFSYLALEESLEKRGRTPNPYQPAIIHRRKIE